MFSFQVRPRPPSGVQGLSNCLRYAGPPAVTTLIGLNVNSCLANLFVGPAWATGRFDLKALWAEEANEKGREKRDEQGYQKGDDNGNKQMNMETKQETKRDTHRQHKCRGNFKVSLKTYVRAGVGDLPV